MTLDEELEAIKIAEKRYEIIDSISIETAQSQYQRPLTLSQISDRFKILHHPYTHAVSEFGHVLLMSVLLPEAIRHQWDQYREAASLIMEEGGTARYDKRSADWIGLISKFTPEDYLSRISDTAWEARLLSHVDNILPVLSAALKLPDNNIAVGLEHEELMDIAAHSQFYKTAKTKGIDAAKAYIPVLQQGMILYT